MGAAFFLALILQSCGRLRLVLAAGGAALAGQIGAVALGAAPGVAQPVACGALLVALAGYLAWICGRATFHR